MMQRLPEALVPSGPTKKKKTTTTTMVRIRLSQHHQNQGNSSAWRAEQGKKNGGDVKYHDTCLEFEVFGRQTASQCQINEPCGE